MSAPVELRLTWSIPSPCGCERNEMRRLHQDLLDMNTTEVETEGYRARLALAFGQFANPWQKAWTRERVLACARELRRRRQ